MHRLEIAGAKWWKFDFHTHTPASSDYRGPKSTTPQQWLLSFMASEIDCVAVTDHNSGEWIDKLKQEYATMAASPPAGFRRLAIFPGVEISVNGGVHLLAIFDPSESKETISRLLGEVRYRGPLGDTDTCTLDSFVDVVQAIGRNGGIAIPAHVDKIRGLFDTLSGTTLRGILASDELLAIELCDATFPKPPLYDELKLALTEVVGSDSHKADEVGRGFTWIKMDEPNLEALRLALHDGADAAQRYDQVITDPNIIANRLHIKSLVVSNAMRAGRGAPLKVRFSPWLTTLIGGRGSGKSSVLNFIRYVLRETDDLPEKTKKDFSEFAQESKGRGKLGMMLPNTEIRLEMVKDAQDVAIVYSQGTITWEKRDEVTKVWVPKGDPGDIRARFPFRLYNQKQLYEITEDPNIILNLIDSRFDKRSWLDAREGLEQEWLLSRQSERVVRQSMSTAALVAELEDVKSKMAIFEDSSVKSTLENYQKKQTLTKKFDQAGDSVSEYAQRVKGAVDSVPGIDISDIVADMDAASSELAARDFQHWNELNQELAAATANLISFAEAWRVSLKGTPWSQSCTDAVNAFTELSRRLEAEGGLDTSSYAPLVARRQELESKIDAARAAEAILAQHEKKSREIFDRIVEMERSLRAMRSSAVATWNVSSGEYGVRVVLEELGNLEQGEERLRSILRKPNGEFSRDIAEQSEDGSKLDRGFFKELSDAVGSTRWTVRESIVNKLVNATVEASNGLDKRFAKHIDALRESSPEDLDKLLTWFPEDRVCLKLLRNGNEEDIESGSAGQRTAGMLSLLLSLNDSPIIIDQPEDDLDNRHISELVVEGLRKLKTNQQIIVVTHNPNIPVNGGAEKIVEMAYQGGQVRVHTSGALQRRDIRKAVCDVMEGGQISLNNRYYRISKSL